MSRTPIPACAVNQLKRILSCQLSHGVKEKQSLPSPFFDKDNVTMYNADCLEVMKAMEPSSIDSVITDPPYGMKFMGKEWDHGIPGHLFWKEALRVSKPGAFLLAFGGTRTFHWLTRAIEMAGWEIRDCIMWVYGSGFPKSHDISKSIDKQAGAERKVIGEYNPQNGSGRGFKTGKYGGSQGVGETTRASVITATTTDEAKLWAGWGTALKPAWEPIIVAMKPLDGTFASNALKYGVAGINVDECRVGGDFLSAGGDNFDAWRMGEGRIDRPESHSKTSSQVQTGRWPANLMHDGSDEVMELFPKKKGGMAVNRNRGKRKRSTVNYANHDGKDCGYGDDGSVARFFYCAKTTKSERGEANNHPTVKPLALMEYLCKLTMPPNGGVVLDPFMGSGSTGLACIRSCRAFVGVEREVDYCKIASTRILAARPKDEEGNKSECEEQRTLF